jgi:hypothetical protein
LLRKKALPGLKWVKKLWGGPLVDIFFYRGDFQKGLASGSKELARRVC